MTILRSLQCGPLVQSATLINFVCFVLIPRALSRTPTYLAVLMIMHFDGISFLSFHNIYLCRYIYSSRLPQIEL
jgi:hypothetical protein